ncbi:MAG TPA: Nif3-like dinuclear metal center hexameric protein [Solirubrobacteraceae bacterium]|nr:Nif3-like dinuclear metal center hexameric protein [Solirubrobacteraceae bacterium]
MAACADILAHLEELLDPSAYDDYGPNGLQVPGRDEIQTIVTGVSANAELFTRAREEGADLVLVHHGLFWQGPPRPLDRPAKRRLQLLFDADMALVAYHLPLDGHLEVGNNALLARRLGARDLAPFAAHKRATIGVRASFGVDGISPAELVARVRDATDREPLAFTEGPDPVRTIGIVSGAGADHLEEAIAEGLDAFVTGEPIERAMARAREAGVHFVAAGHYATETFGVRALGDRLAERFGVRHIYVDVPNPI